MHSGHIRREVVKRVGSLDATTGLSLECLVLSVRNTRNFLVDVNFHERANSVLPASGAKRPILAVNFARDSQHTERAGSASDAYSQSI